MGFHYCHLKAISGCSSGGWTHVMTIDGTKVNLLLFYSYAFYPPCHLKSNGANESYILETYPSGL